MCLMDFRLGFDGLGFETEDYIKKERELHQQLCHFKSDGLLS